MNVKEIMSKEVITVNKNEKITEAFKLMTDHSIRHLPVIENHSLVGIASDRDIRQAIMPWKPCRGASGTFYNVENVTVEEVMSKDLITISINAHVEDAAKIFYELKIGSLPVVDDERLLGIITESDILGVFIEMMGILESSCRLDVQLDRSPKAFEEVCRIIKKNDSNIISVGMTPIKHKNKRVCFFRLEQCNMLPIVESLKRAGYKIISVLN